VVTVGVGEHRAKGKASGPAWLWMTSKAEALA
jgi:hypothetical protein